MNQRRFLSSRFFRRPWFEFLEDRLAPAAANIFAEFVGIVPSGALASFGARVNSSTNFTLDGGKIVVGVVACAANGSSLNPAAVKALKGSTVVTPVYTANNLPGRNDSLTLVELSGTSYTLQVGGEGNSAGSFRLEVFLPGDVDGNRKVDNADGLAIRAMYGSRIDTPNYRVEGDADRDGIITATDVNLWRRNLNDATKITPLGATITLMPDPVRLGDGTLLTNVAGSSVSGTVTSSSVRVELETGGDGTFDNGSTMANAAGRYSIPTTLAEGNNPLQLRLTDGFGQQQVVTQLTALDTIVPTFGGGLTVEGLLSGSVTFFDLSYNEVMGTGAFEVANYTLTVTAGPGAGGAMTIARVERLSDTKARLHFPAVLPDGQTYRVTASAAVTDLARNPLAAPRKEEFTVAESFTVAAISPTDGEEGVSVTRPVIVDFTEEIDPSSLGSGAVQVISLGHQLPGRLAVSSTGRFLTFYPTDPFPAATEIRILVDGAQIRARSDGHLLDADRDGFSEGVATADIQTLPLTRIVGTNVFGYVYDSYNKNPDGSNKPIVGATIRVDDFPEANVVTDASGFFELRDMPAPGFFVHIDGTTAINAPAGTMYPSVGKEFHSVPGQRVQLTMDGTAFHVYLPPMAMGDIVNLSLTQTTQVGFGAGGLSELQALFPAVDPVVWQRLKVGFAPNAAVDRGGNPAIQATVIPVPPDRLPAPLPPNASPKLVISIQALGATQFDIPAPVTFPNLEGAEPGEKSLIWSFDHDAGRWEVIGNGTVSPDGLTIVSDPGVGVRAPGWHFTIRGSLPYNKANTNKGDKDTSDGKCDDEKKADALSAASRLRVGYFLAGAPTAQELLNYFLSGAGREESGRIKAYDEGSPLAKAAASSDEFKESNRVIQDELQKALDTAVASDKKNLNNVIKVTLDAKRDKVHWANKSSQPDLYYSVKGTQGVDLSGDIRIEGSRYKGTLKYTYSDTYGFGTDDHFCFLGSCYGDHMRYLQVHCEAHWFIIKLTVSVPFDRPANLPASDGLGPQGDGSEPEIPVSTVPGFGSDPAVYYRYFLDSGLEITGKTNRSGIIEAVLPPNVPYRLSLYAPASNSWTSLRGTTAPSGSTFSFGEPGSDVVLDQRGGLDNDGDGIPNVGELVLGTDPDQEDSDGDRIKDGAELEQGLNPVDDRAFPTGVIASVPLQGSAEQVAVEGNRVYVATGIFGLAVVDGTRFNNPTLLGQVDLPGTATGVSVDGALGIAAVAAGSVLHLVDISDGMAPRLIRSVTITATHVEVANGLAYVASGTSVRIVDLVSGGVIQSVPLPGSGSVTGFAREGTKLYAYVSGSDTFSVIDISDEGSAAVRGQVSVSVASSDVGLFLGGGIAWLAGSGLRTLDVSNPASPQIIATPSGSQFFTARRIALNGSGLGLLLPDGGNFLQVYDTSDPNNVANLLLQVSLNGNARAVAISRGIAYIAAGGRLEVVNYRPFDNLRIAPTISIGTSAVDRDAITPGLQIFEGTTVPVAVSANDDVQVAKVELFLNSNVVRTDVSFPFDFFAAAPALAPGASSFTLQVRATDTGGNVALSNVLTIDLVEDTFAPTLLAFEPPSNASRVEPLTVVQVRFSEPMDPTTVTSTTVRVRDAAGNLLAPLNFQLRDDDRFVQLTYAPLAMGSYQIVVAGTAADRAGNRLGADDVVSSFTLTPRATLATTAPDTDPGTPGLQVFEGTTLPVSVNVTAGVSVQQVTLLVNGQTTGNDAAAPYEFTVVAPNIAPGADLLTLQARVTDTAGFTTLTNLLTLGLREDVTPPTIVATNPADGSTAFRGLQTIQVVFSESMAAATFSVANFELFEAGLGGVFGDGNDVSVGLSGVSSGSDDAVAQLATPPLLPGLYQARVNRASVTDRAGNPAGIDTFTSTFSVQDRPGLNDLLNLRGTPYSGGLTLSSSQLTLGINSGGSLITGGTGLVFDGREFVIWGTPVWNYSLTYNGSIFANGNSFGGLTRENLSSGTFRGVRLVGNAGSGLRMERVIAFTEGEQYAVIATRLTNLTGTPLSSVAWMENTDPDQGIPLGLGFATSNDVVLGGDLVRAHVTSSQYPGGLTMGYGSADPRAVASAEGFSNTSPFAIINSPVDPNGGSSDIGINLAFNLGMLPALGSVTSGLILTLGRSVTEAEQVYQQAAAITAPGLPLRVTTAGPSAAAVPEEEVRRLAVAAERFWEQALGVGPVSPVNVRVVDLPGGELGRAVLPSGSETADLLIDDDANGIGWFVDRTPFTPEEFVFTDNSGSALAPAGSPAADRYDLFTVLLHEVGHLYGIGATDPTFVRDATSSGATLTADGSHLDADTHPYDLMNETLPPSVRRLPSPLDVRLLRQTRSTSIEDIATPYLSVGTALFPSEGPTRPVGEFARRALALPEGVLRHSHLLMSPIADTVVSPVASLRPNDRVVESDDRDVPVVLRSSSPRDDELVDAVFADFTERDAAAEASLFDFVAQAR